VQLGGGAAQRAGFGDGHEGAHVVNIHCGYTNNVYYSFATYSDEP
jgi:hypothetical protein